jgi:toxin-antitoxin system PIN domain toxin
MILIDVNVLIYAHRESSAQHFATKEWLLDTLNSPSAYGLSELVLSSFVRVVTHSKIFNPPSTIKQAFTFVTQLRNRSNCVIIQPEAQHWKIFESLCEKSQATGNLVADAYHAALAIESGSEWITFDRDYSRFEGLKWRTPF